MLFNTVKVNGCAKSDSVMLAALLGMNFLSGKMPDLYWLLKQFEIAEASCLGVSTHGAGFRYTII
jgi:hypothetical protein